MIIDPSIFFRSFSLIMNQRFSLNWRKSLFDIVFLFVCFDEIAIARVTFWGDLCDLMMFSFYFRSTFELDFGFWILNIEIFILNFKSSTPQTSKPKPIPPHLPSGNIFNRSNIKSSTSKTLSLYNKTHTNAPLAGCPLSQHQFAVSFFILLFLPLLLFLLLLPALLLLLLLLLVPKKNMFFFFNYTKPNLSSQTASYNPPPLFLSISIITRVSGSSILLCSKTLMTVMLFRCFSSLRLVLCRNFGVQASSICPSPKNFF